MPGSQNVIDKRADLEIDKAQGEAQRVKPYASHFPDLPKAVTKPAVELLRQDPSTIADQLAYRAITACCGTRFLSNESGLVELRELRAFQRQVVHQALRTKDKAHDWIFDVVTVDGLACTNIDQRDRTIYADLPAF